MRLHKRSAGIPEVGKALYVAVAAMLFFSVYTSCGICSAAQEGTLDYTSIANSIGPQSTASPPQMEAAAVPAVPETLESATLVLTKPKPSSLIPYTQRGFDESTVAAIAWWMNPKFAANTSEYRNYLRASPEDKARLHSPETRIFFDFITKHLDIALDKSILDETLILYRGLSGNVAYRVINNSEYIEPAYASTAYDVTVSLDIFGSRSPDGYQNVLVLQRAKGKHALYVNEDEREFLIPRGTRWDVIKSINIENLTVEADFPLYESCSDEAQFNKVRLIYIRERND